MVLGGGGGGEEVIKKNFFLFCKGNISFIYSLHSLSFMYSHTFHYFFIHSLLTYH